MKLIKENDTHVIYECKIWGTIKLRKWNDFLKEQEILDKIDDVNEGELQDGYNELCKEYIGAP